MPPVSTTEIHEHAFVAEGVLLTDVRGALATPVLSTPGMIAMMEYAATSLALLHVPVGKATVGFEVNVRHVAPAPAGARCTARAAWRTTSMSTSRSSSDGRMPLCGDPTLRMPSMPLTLPALYAASASG